MSDQTSTPSAPSTPAAAPSSAPAAATPDTSNAPAGQAPAAPGTEPKVAKKPPAFRKYKIGDQEVSLSDEDIARDYSKWKSADQKFREAAEARKSLESFYEALQKDPEKVLADPRLPVDRRKLAEKWMLEAVEAELKQSDPRDVKLTEMEQRLKDYEEKERHAAEEAKRAEHEQLVTQRKTEIAKVFEAAIAASPLTKHPESRAALLREMALYTRIAKERGENPSPEEIVDHIHNTRFHQMHTLANSMAGEELIEFLGQDVVQKIRQADLARLRAQRNPPAVHRTSNPVVPASKSAQTVDPTEVRMKLRGW